MPSIKLPSKRKTKDNYTWVLKEYAPGKFIPKKVTVQEFEQAERLIEEQELQGTYDNITEEMIYEAFEERYPSSLRVRSVINNFLDVVHSNILNLSSDAGSKAFEFRTLMELIRKNRVTHNAFNEWANQNRHLFESVFYQSTFKTYIHTPDGARSATGRWGELSNIERGEYEEAFDRSFDENVDLVIQALKDILDAYGIKY